MEIFSYIVNGWSPIISLVSDGARIVMKVVGWTGGTGGSVPASDVYIGATGYVPLIADAVDVRGSTGATGATGATGNTGATGAGVAAGGTANQALTKINSTDYNTQWATIDKAFVGLGNVDNTSDSTKNAAVATFTNKTIAVSGPNTISGITNANLSGSAAITYANLQQVSAFKILGNSTNAAVVPSEITFKQIAQQVFPTTPTWTGTTPSGTSNVSYVWSQIGNQVTLIITAVYATAGASNTAVTFTLPSDCPNPTLPAGLSGASSKVYPGYGYIDSNIAGNPSNGRAIMHVNAANNGYEISIISASVSAKYAQCTIIYYI